MTPKTPAWREVVARYQAMAPLHAIWQLANTLIPYLALWALMVWTLQYSYWLTLPLLFPAAGLLIRLFIIFHDCGHGSFFRSRRAGDTWGFITGVLIFTPYERWRHKHALHHATSGDLDRRGAGDVWTLTVQEYLEASRWKRCAYRLARNPIVLFVLAPLYLFLVHQRFPSPGDGKRQRRSVYHTNAALLIILLAMSATIGMKAYLLIQIPMLLIAAVGGVWLFYVQHQFEGVYWERKAQWDYGRAALEGSSYYKLPRVLQWFTGNIGFHHIHHLSPTIPNYNLERCHRENPIFEHVRVVTPWFSLRSLSLRLWDEQRRKLVGYRVLADLRKAQKPTTG